MQEVSRPEDAKGTMMGHYSNEHCDLVADGDIVTIQCSRQEALALLAFVGSDCDGPVMIRPPVLIRRLKEAVEGANCSE